MQSPFKIFRKHQKGVLVVMVFAAMILFGLGDIIMKMGRTGGAAQANRNVVDTNVGGLSQMAMNNLIVNRRTLQRFIASAYQKTHPDMEKNPYFGQFIQMIVRQFGFGGISQGEVLYSWLHRHEARKMGIVVTDKQIQDYIERFTDRKLSTTMFKDILDNLQIGPKQLFDMFREELQADIAQRMKLPPQLPSPEKYWEYYQQLNTREKIEVAAVPVDDFTESVAEPAAAQVAALFEKHKNDFESAFNGEFKPGFRQPRKVNLHYLTMTAGAIEDKVLAAGPVTEKEIEEFYEQNKDTVRWLHEVETPPPNESAPLDPDFAPEKGPALDSGLDDDDKQSSDKESKKGDQDDRAKKNSAPADDADETDAPEKPSDCDGAPAAAGDDAAEPDPQPAAVEKEDAARPPAGEKPAGEKPAGEKPGENDEKDDAKEAVPGDSDAATDGEESEKPRDGRARPKKTEPPKIKYKPLDDDLRERIRDSLIQERRQKLMKDQMARAAQALRGVGRRFSTSSDIKLTDPNAEQLKTIERRSDEELAKIAGELGMKFEKTGLVTDLELTKISGLGKSVEAVAGDAARGEAATIVDQAFGNEALCREFESETLIPEAIYVGWKVQDSPVHVPRLEDAGIREQVVKAIKRIESLPLAKKRAEELAERVRKSEEDFAAAVGGQTVTGDPRGLAVTVAESKEFSFYRDSSAPNMFRQSQGPTVELGNPIVVTNAGRPFMRVVFNELAEGEVGVALNDDASVYYVVKVISRRPADREAFKDAALFGYSSPYSQLAQIELAYSMNEYRSRLGEKYAVKFNDAASREMGPMDDE